MRTTIIDNNSLIETAYTEKYDIQLSQTKNNVGFKCDDNGIIKNGVFQGCMLDMNICQGNKRIKNLDKLVDAIEMIGAVIICLYFIGVIVMAKVNVLALNAAMVYGTLILLSVGMLVCLSVIKHVYYKKTLEYGHEYKGVLYDIRCRASGKSRYKECYFAIWDNGKVRIVKELIIHQPFNRIASIKKDEALIGQEFTVIASPDETGYCIRKK